MAKRELDNLSGVETTGHEWDGIKELDNPLPRWWLYVLYGCIVWSIGYWIAMPSWPLWNSYTKGVLGFSERATVDKQVAASKAALAPKFAQLEATPLEQVKSNPDLYHFAQEAGRTTFADNCATCHGAGGSGNPGYPNLADDVWLHAQNAGGNVNGIEQTIKYGIRSTNPKTLVPANMPHFGKDGLLTDSQINNLTDYVMTLSKIPGADAASAAQGAKLFADNCSSCHGATGTGDPKQGAPNLTDKDYLYGGNRQAIHNQIFNGNNNVMPTWEARLDPATIKALTIYVQSLGGGK